MAACMPRGYEHGCQVASA